MRFLQSHSKNEENQPGFHGFGTKCYSSSSSFLPSLSLPQQPTTTHYQCISTLKGHTSYVFSLVLYGKHLYSGSYDDEIRVWTRDLTTLHHILVDDTNIVANSNGAVKSLVILNDKIFSSHQDHKIRVWKIDNLNTTHHQKRYRCMATLPTMNDRFLSLFSSKNYVQVRRHKTCTWVHHVDTVSALAVSKDGSLLYSASWDRSFKVWNTSDFRCLESVAKAHDDAINALILCKDGHIYTGSADKTIKVWKKHKGEKKHSLETTLMEQKSAVNALAVSSDENVLYCGASDGSIVVWERECDGNKMTVVGALRGHTKAVLCLGVVSDVLFSGSADNSRYGKDQWLIRVIVV